MKEVLLFLALTHLFVPSTHAASSLGGNCQARYGEVGSDGTFKYFETGVGNLKCDNSNGANLVCIPENDDGTNSDFPGICEAKYCMEPELATQGKVTVCHRTCSETNPWVRITIDSSAWSNTNCKHGQHTTAKCTGKNLTLWGENQQDYILKYHGTRDEVAASLNGVSTDINNYWKHWEPACPSVRNGFCCQFSGTYGYSCCGRGFLDPIPPPPTPKQTPAPIAPTVPPTPSPTPRPTTAAPVIVPVTPAPVMPAPTLAPVTSPVATQAPQASPTVAPITAPVATQTPQASPTLAPVTTAVVTPSPQASPTIAPVVAASPTVSPTSSTGGAPSPSNICRLRRQLQQQQQGQTLDQKWTPTSVTILPEMT